jgi:hypothetical protein
MGICIHSGLSLSLACLLIISTEELAKCHLTVFSWVLLHPWVVFRRRHAYPYHKPAHTDKPHKTFPPLPTPSYFSRQGLHSPISPVSVTSTSYYDITNLEHEPTLASRPSIPLSIQLPNMPGHSSPNTVSASSTPPRPPLPRSSSLNYLFLSRVAMRLQLTP